MAPAVATDSIHSYHVLLYAYSLCFCLYEGRLSSTTSLVRDLSVRVLLLHLFLGLFSWYCVKASSTCTECQTVVIPICGIRSGTHVGGSFEWSPPDLSSVSFRSNFRLNVG